MAGASAAGVAGLGLGGLPAANASVGAAGAAGSDASAVPDAAAGATQVFVSRPDLKPPPYTLQRFGSVSPSRYIFLDVPYTGPGHGGAIIIDSHGELIWMGPNTATEHRLDFNVQTLNGQPVLTWWQGLVVQGHGEGECIIADSTYKVIHTLKMNNGVNADLHEFAITPQGKALISGYRTHTGVDLSSVGGPATGGVIYSGVFQQIDITSGTVEFEWDSYNAADPTNSPVPISESNLPLAGHGTAAVPYDYFHINSIDTDAQGNYIVSGRHTWTIYKLAAADRSIIWRLNGKNSDFHIGPGANFSWQHHVRPHGHGQLTIFDNGSCSQVVKHEKQSRALIIAFDETTKQVTLVKGFHHPKKLLLGRALGAAQILPGGGMFVDWGAARQFSQFDANGNMVLDCALVPGASSYRGFSKEWTGTPAGLPAVAARHRTGGATVYASWNGATHIKSWTVFAGPASSSLTKVATVPRAGFETAIPVTSTGPFFAVQATNTAGHALARSKAVKIA